MIYRWLRAYLHIVHVYEIESIQINASSVTVPPTEQPFHPRQQFTPTTSLYIPIHYLGILYILYICWAM